MRSTNVLLKSYLFLYVAFYEILAVCLIIFTLLNRSYNTRAKHSPLFSLLYLSFTLITALV
jgi:hypothetical protein